MSDGLQRSGASGENGPAEPSVGIRELENLGVDLSTWGSFARTVRTLPEERFAKLLELLATMEGGKT